MPANIDLTGYADDNIIPYILSSNKENVLNNLQGALQKVFHWFSTNHLVPNAGKCHLLTSSKTPVDIHVSNNVILIEEKVKLLGVSLEGRLNFHFHLNTLLKKASKKYHTLARVCNSMNKKKRRIIMNAFIASQFSYCPFLCMSHSSFMNNRINKIQEKSLRVVYKYEKISL